MSTAPRRSTVERIDLHLTDVAIESEPEVLSLIPDCDTLCLAIFELKGEGACGVYPLKRVSKTKWIHEKAITLPKKLTDLAMALLESERLDDLDLWTFVVASEITPTNSTRKNAAIKITKRMLDGKEDKATSVKLSLHVRASSTVPVSASSARPTIRSSMRLEDMTIDLGQGYIEHPGARRLLLVAFESPDDGHGGVCESPLRMISKGSAKCDDYVQVSATAEDVVVVIKSELSGDLECFCLTRQELDQVDFYRGERLYVKSIHGSGGDAERAILSLKVRPMSSFTSRWGRDGSELVRYLRLLAVCRREFARLFQITGNPSVKTLELQLQEIHDALSPLNPSLSSASTMGGNGSLDDEISGLVVTENSVPPEYAPRAALQGLVELRFHLLQTADDLERCIKLRLQVMDQEHDAVWWSGLADFTQLRYERSQNVEDLDLAVMARRNQLDRIPPNDQATRGQALAGYAQTLRHRVASGKPWSRRDVEKNIEVFKHGIAGLPPRGPETFFALCGLTTALHDRFEMSDDPADIHEELFYHRKTVSAAGGDPNLIGAASLKLVFGLHACGIKLANQEYLDEAISTAKEYLAMFPESNSTQGRHFRGNMLFLLFRSIAYKYEATRDTRYLREAASISEQAFAYQPLHGETELQAATYGDLATYSENPEHRRIAETYLKAAVAKGAASHDTLSTFSFFLVQRFSQEKNPSLLREAIAVQEQRIRMIPKTHFLHASSLWVLGTILQKLFGVTGDANVFNRAFNCYASAAMAETTTPHIRLQAAKAWAAFLPLVPIGRGSAINLAPLDNAIESIRQLAGLEQTVEQRHQQLTDLSQFVLTASGHALALGRNDKAVEWLERGRGLIWDQLSSLRTPLDDLCLQHPALATQLEVVCRRLENASTQSRRPDQSLHTESKVSLQEEAAAHARLARERDELIETIRNTIPGFENFLGPQDSSSWLENLPESGAVVLVHVSKSTTLSRAIVLLPGLDEPMIIELSDFSYEKAEKLRDKLRASLLHNHLLQRSRDQDTEGDRGFRLAQKGAGKKGSPSQVLQDVLRELWACVVKPVVDGLALSRSQHPETRIWWCPTGPLTSLPLHAAGIYQVTQETETILDYAVSSYIPTVTMLTERVKNARIAPKQDNKVGLCMLSQPDAPGFAFIPGTKKEIDRIAQVLDNHSVRTHRLEGGDAVRRAGLDAMGNYSCIHLACHGTQNAQEPLKSGFALGDGMLDLSTIMKSNLKHADFAFLSACQTSTGDVKLSEESVHLAAGMLATGYRGVVGTMWSISDHHAPLVAESFYRDLIANSAEVDGTKRLDGSQAAYALHHAIGELRKSVGDANVLDWAPYVHFGL